MKSGLPIDKHLPAIRTALEERRCAVVTAAPGAGKTTRIPLALLGAGFVRDKKILMLEPRRLAAVSCAKYMASQLGEKVGQTVGYRIRLENRVGQNTRIEVVTEGIFTRMIQNDPGLESIGLVIFDEFHERNIHSDVGLALCMDTFEGLNETLRLMVMSATMDTDAVSRLLSGAPVIASEGKSFQVKTTYMPPQPPAQTRQNISERELVENQCGAAIAKALKKDATGILVFLPGIGEIKSLQKRLKPNLHSNIDLVVLHGSLPSKDQEQAIAPPTPGRAKIILATAVAETAITIDGIDAVVDAGLMRVPEFSWKSGMTQLKTLPVTKAAADQRRGRAGRTGPGICFRLWSEYEHSLLKPYTLPEILNADLTGVLLELALWGVRRFEDLKWLDLPRPGAIESATTLLQTLEALDEDGNITSHGRKMAGSGLHPRLSHMIIKSLDPGLGPVACRLAALMGERDFIRFAPGMADPDVGLRLEWLEAVEKKQKTGQSPFYLNRQVVRRILASEKKICKDFGVAQSAGQDGDQAGRVLAFAFPDRIAKKRPGRKQTYLTSSGKGIWFPHACSLAESEYVVAIHLDGNPKNAKIFLAAAYDKAALEADFSQQIVKQQQTFLDENTGVIQAAQQQLFHDLMLDSVASKTHDPNLAVELLLDYVRKNGLRTLPWTSKLENFRERAMFLRKTGVAHELPDVSEEALIRTLDQWFGPFLVGINSLKQLAHMDLATAFYTLFSWEKKRRVEKLAPTHIRVPSGSRKPLKYGSNGKILDAPLLEVRLQEMFGLAQTPAIADGRIPVTLVLLSPASRPVQVTQDLASFWENAYPEVKKDLAGRYPKHFWPEDPLSAQPTSRAKPRKGRQAV